ncbi:MAG TPA: hypothetical protein PKI59_05055 [Candidatus Cloacimonadota bacterium]|nr:hypothetical protein [Candidatus Cloacimonadota bacterium]
MILSKFARYLIDKNYFPAELVEAASRKCAEYGDNSAGSLAKIMVSDFAVAHDSVFEALSRHYAFPQRMSTLMRCRPELSTTAKIS